MILRTSGESPRGSERSLRCFRLLAVLAGGVVLLLSTLVGGSGAGVSAYQGTLYLNGSPSIVSGTSFQILSAAGPAVPATPSAVAGIAGSGSLALASYQYVQVTSSGGANTASAVSNAPNVPALGSVAVSNLQIGADLYRAKVTVGVVLGNYVLASPPGGVTAAVYLDTGAINGAALPQADTRHATGAPGVGWSDFVPGTGLATTGLNSAVVGSAPSLPATCKGWVVDAAGGMSFPAGNWTFARRVKPGAINNGTAVLTVAMWKVDDTGATVGGSYLISPTDGDVITNIGGTALTATVSGASAAFTLAINEHLCVQFGRHQTVAYTNGSTAHTISLLADDPANQISVHPAPNSFASAALSSPADGFPTNSIPSLSATYSDPEGNAGTLTIRLCSDAGCSAGSTSGALAATNGATLSWTPPGPLADGTYHWDAQAQDTLGLPSAWTASNSFVMDTAVPATSLNSPPPAQSNAASGTFSFTASEAVTGYQCRIDGAPFAGCTSPYS